MAQSRLARWLNALEDARLRAETAHLANRFAGESGPRAWRSILRAIRRRHP